MDEEQEMKKYEIIYEEGSTVRTLLIFLPIMSGPLVTYFFFKCFSTKAGIISAILFLAVFVAALVWNHKAKNSARKTPILTIDDQGIYAHSIMTGGSHYIYWDNVVYTDVMDDMHSGITLVVEAKTKFSDKNRKVNISLGRMAGRDSLETALYNFHLNHKMKKQQEKQNQAD